MRVSIMHSDYFTFNEVSAALMRSAGLLPLRVVVGGSV